MPQIPQTREAFDGVWSEWRLVTPELAREWLRFGHPTQRVDPEVVTLDARWMRAGRWVDHWGLLWSPHGRLLDGRNRLMAVAEAGVSVWMLVTYGIDDALFEGLTEETT